MERKVHTENTEIELADNATIPVDDSQAVIDSLDAQLIEVLKFRQRVSAQIQRQRMADGGPRVVLSREMEIISRYSAALGLSGSAIATDILALCRGRRRGQGITAELGG